MGPISTNRLPPRIMEIFPLLDAQAEEVSAWVKSIISPDDENYEFITMTLAVSLTNCTNK